MAPICHSAGSFSAESSELAASQMVVARAGDQAPGAPDGFRFLSFNPGGYPPPLLNARGEVAFGLKSRGEEPDTSSVRTKRTS